MKQIIRRSCFIRKLNASFQTVLFLLFIPCSILSSQQIVHKVDDRDTLFGLSLLYNTSVHDIMKANNLDSEIIRKGAELLIPDAEEAETEGREADIETYTVRRGDTLSEIAARFDLKQKQLIQLNNLAGSTVKVGQELVIPSRASAGEIYFVRSGDTLSKISLLFDVSQEQLKLMNNLNGESLRIDQELTVAPLRPQLHTVEKGDSLWDIAVRYKISTEDLTAWNNLSGSTIRPGQDIKLYPWTVDDFESGDEKPPVLLASVPETIAQPPLEEYVNYHESKESQPSRGYSESRLDNPALNYRQAKALLDDLDNSIARERRLSNDLAGYTIVLDPGHGGLDPGAIVPSVNGNGETLYVVEDEYAYDISLRTYRLLKLHGADVTLTVISPNHQIRNSENPSNTFINMKNEVYNMASLNRGGDECWPVGGARGLRKRVEIAEEAFKGAERDKTLFISIHADNSPDMGQGTIVLYSAVDDRTLERSEKLAEELIPYLGASSSVKRQNLAVLRDNPAYAEVLIEIRNLHYPGNSWAIRYDKLRQQDAEFITAGLINYAESRR